MPKTISKTNRWIRRSLFAAALIIIAFGGIYWYVATEQFADTADRKPAFSVEANSFLSEFEQDAKSANEKYTEKIVAVTGIVSEREMADTTVNIKMTDSTTGSYLIFAFQPQHLDDASNLKPGDKVTLKGACSGSVYSEILGIHFIAFKRSAIHKS